MPDKILVLDIAPSELLVLDLEMGKQLPAQYDGDYQITPDNTEKTLETADKLMTQNVVVEPVPHYIVSNMSGGTTFVIG